MELKKSSGNIFEDLGFDPAEAEVLKVKAQLKLDIEKEIKARGLSQAKAAQLVGVARPAFNRLMNNKLEGISVDKMINIKYLLGLGTEVRTVKIKKRTRGAKAAFFQRDADKATPGDLMRHLDNTPDASSQPGDELPDA